MTFIKLDDVTYTHTTSSLDAMDIQSISVTHTYVKLGLSNSYTITLSVYC